MAVSQSAASIAAVSPVQLAPHVGRHQLAGPREAERRHRAAVRLVPHLAWCQPIRRQYCSSRPITAQYRGSPTLTGSLVPALSRLILPSWPPVARVSAPWRARAVAPPPPATCRARHSSSGCRPCSQSGVSIRSLGQSEASIRSLSQSDASTRSLQYQISQPNKWQYKISRPI